MSRCGELSVMTGRTLVRLVQAQKIALLALPAGPICTKAKTVSVISSSLFSLQHWPQGLTVLETALDSLELV